MQTCKQSLKPLVSIGIPTYNRSSLLKQAIESALNQDYGNIEVIVSDNASTDDTESVCRYYSKIDARFKYIRQASNRGPTANFTEVRNNATGKFFMWLGDDDYLDLNYVSECVRLLSLDLAIVLVSGQPRYYRNGQIVFEGAISDLDSDKWCHRVISFYVNADNCIFHGVMYSAHIRNIDVPNTMGGDWLVLANIASLGKTKTIPQTCIHKVLGGVSSSYKNTASVLGLPKFQAYFPMTSTAISAWLDIVVRGTAFKSRPIFMRLVVGTVVFGILITKYMKNRIWRLIVPIGRFIVKRNNKSESKA